MSSASTDSFLILTIPISQLWTTGPLLKVIGVFLLVLLVLVDVALLVRLDLASRVVRTVVRRSEIFVAFLTRQEDN
jgi:hypothetical protein